jgi:protein-tyrosine phosphatase
LAWLHEQTGKRERILIHCKHGISRSPGFLAAFMVASGISSTLEEATAAISVHRPVHPADADCGIGKASLVDLRADWFAEPAGF